MDAGVQRAVLVPPSWEADRNDMCLAAAREFPERFAAMGRLAIEEESSREALSTWRANPGMLGVRLRRARATLVFGVSTPYLARVATLHYDLLPAYLIAEAQGHDQPRRPRGRA